MALNRGYRWNDMRSIILWITAIASWLVVTECWILNSINRSIHDRDTQLNDKFKPLDDSSIQTFSHLWGYLLSIQLALGMIAVFAVIRTVIRRRNISVSSGRNL